MFSIMMTVESTTMPKSTAPSEIRFAGVPVATMPMNAMSSASGMLSAVMSAARAWPRKRKSTSVTSTMPTSRFSSTVCVVSFTSVAAVVVGLDVHPRRQEVVLADVVDALVDAVERRRRLAAVAHEHDALHDVGLVVVADDAEARRVADARPSATSRTRTGVPFCAAIDDVADVVHVADEADAADVVRLLADR